jgi:hypothetical protein
MQRKLRKQAARIQDQNCRPTNSVLPAPRVLWREGACIAAVVLLQLGPRPAQLISFLLLIVWAVSSAHGIVQSLSLGVLIVGANPGLGAVEPQIFVLKWVLIFACFVRIAFSGRRYDRRGPAWLPSFGVFVGVTTILVLLVSYDRVLSGFKLISFAAGAIVALLGVAGDTRPPRYWLNWFFTVHCVVVLLSVPLLFFPVGYKVNARSFQGILNHPQEFAVYLAMWGSYLIAYLLTTRCVNLFLLLVAGLTTYFIIASNCRGAILAMAMAAVVSGLTAIFSPRPGRDYLSPWTVKRLCAIGLLAIGLLAYDSSRVIAPVFNFVMKGYKGGGDGLIAILAGSFQASRGEEVQTLMGSIAEHPLAGVGFGLVPSGVVQIVERDPILGLPVSASTEEGFLPLAVLTQVGIIGALVLGAFLVKLAAPILKSAPLPVIMMFSSALMVNIGEMIFFAVGGGFGLQMWLILGLCHEYSACEGRRVEDRVPHALWGCVPIGTRRKGTGYAG